MALIRLDGQFSAGGNSSLIKPFNAAGDFFVIPRLLGHSSLQVSLTHYTHTLDIVAALFQGNGLIKEVLADRDIGPLIHKRFQAGLQVRESALVWSPEPLAKFKPEAKLSTVLSRSQHLNKILLNWLARCRGGEPADAVLPKGMTFGALKNWFSPRQAVKLQDRLNSASDQLTDDDVDLLSRLGTQYWQASPPMFWFSEARCHAGDDPAVAIVNDAVALINLILKCGFSPYDFVTWRYAKADEKSHKQIWSSALAKAGLIIEPNLRGGRSDNAKCLGISLNAGNVKRTELLSVWWLGLSQGLSEGPK